MVLSAIRLKRVLVSTVSWGLGLTSHPTNLNEQLPADKKGSKFDSRRLTYILFANGNGAALTLLSKEIGPGVSMSRQSRCVRSDRDTLPFFTFKLTVTLTGVEISPPGRIPTLILREADIDTFLDFLIQANITFSNVTINQWDRRTTIYYINWALSITFLLYF